MLLFPLVALFPVFVDGFSPRGCPQAVAPSNHNTCAIMSDNNLYCSGASYGNPFGNNQWNQGTYCGQGRADLSTYKYVNFRKVVDGTTERDRKVFDVSSCYNTNINQHCKCAIVEGDDLNSREVTCFGNPWHQDRTVSGRGEYYGKCLFPGDDTIRNCPSAGCRPDVSFLIKGENDRDSTIPNTAYVPIPMPNGFTPESIFATLKMTCVLGSESSSDKKALYCWGPGAPAATPGVANRGKNFPADFGDNLVKMDFGDRSIVHIAVGKLHQSPFCVLFDDNTVSCSRHNLDTVYFPRPGTEDELDGAVIVDLYAGELHFCALLSSGDLYCWGENRYLQAGGEGSTTSWNDGLIDPVKINLGGKKVKMAALDSQNTCVLLEEDNTVRCWGDTANRHLGHCNNGCQYGRHVAAGSNLDPVNLQPRENAVPVHITAGDQTKCAVFSDGSMQCWGYGYWPTEFQISGMDSSLTVSCDYEKTCEDFTDADCASDGETFYTKSKGKDQVCGASSPCNKVTCCKASWCELDEWGTDLPLLAADADGNKVVLENKLDESSELHLKFTLATETCVDRSNWLGVTYHKLGTPVCTGGDSCSGQSEEDCLPPCKFRIPCGQKLAASLSDAVFGKQPDKEYVPERASVSSSDASLKTNFVIKVKTGQLTQDGAGDIYTAATQPDEDGETKGKLEFCVRPAVTAGETEILYRELVLRIHVGMSASFTVQVDSDSFQEGAVQNVDTDSISITAEAFSCSASGDGYVKDDNTPTLTPNQVFTLCVIGSSASLECEDITTLNFYQPRGETTASSCNVESATCNEDKRVVDGDSSNLLLTSEPQNAVQVVIGTSNHKGCVVSTRLDSDYFADINPGSVTMTGTALLDFKSSSRRKLSESSQDLKMFERRSLQEKQTAKFNLNFKLDENEDPSNKVPQNEVDAASSSKKFVAAVLTTAAVSAMI